MRVRDLDWPDDLFTDAIIHVSETIAVFPLVPERPTLWKEMAELWIGNDAYAVARECALA